MSSSNHHNKSWIPTFVLGAAAATAVGFAVYKRQQQSISKSTSKRQLPLDNIQEKNGNASEEALVTARFQKCVELMGPQLSKSLSQQQQLNYYGLFKQATLGNAGEYMPAPPPKYDIVASAKYSAWQKRHGMTRLAAMQEYIDAVVTYEYTKSIIGGNDNDDDDDNNYELEGDAVMDVVGMGNKPSTLANATGSDSFYDCIEGGDDDDDKNNSTMYAKYPLHEVAREGRLEELQTLLSNNSDDNIAVNPNQLDPAGQTPLHLAADQGHLECMKALILHQANIHAVDTEGIGILHAAVIAGNVHCCRLLLALGCDPKQPDHDGETPWDAAQDEPALKKLLEEHETTPITLQDSVFEEELQLRGIDISRTTANANVPKVESVVDMQKEIKKLDSPMDLDLDDDGDM